MRKPVSEQMQKVAERYEKATGKKFGQLTNAQKIRSMTDKELAEYLYDRVGIAAEHIAYCENNPECELMLESDICIPDAMCKECLRRWLKQSYGGDT